MVLRAVVFTSKGNAMSAESSKFKFLTDEEGNRHGCDCCQYKAPLVPFVEGKQTHYLCEVCYSTYLSYAILYPSPDTDRHLYCSVGWIANRLLDQMGAFVDGKFESEVWVDEDEGGGQ